MSESARPPSGLPPYLRVVEVFKPTTRATDARTTEKDETLPAGGLTAPRDDMDGMWE